MSEGLILRGQEFDPRSGLTVAFTQQMMDKVSGDDAVGNARTEVIPQDRAASNVKVYAAYTQDQLDAFKYSYPDYVNMSGILPSVLTGVAAFHMETKGIGAAEDLGDVVNVGGTVGVSLQLSAKASSSVTSIPEVQLTIYTPWAVAVPSTTYVFYMLGSPTEAQVIAKLNALYAVTVLAMPQFKPEAVDLFITGRQVSVSAGANVQQSLSLNTTSGAANRSVGIGESYSTEVGGTLQIKRIEPTLHGAVVISSPTNTETVDVDARAYMPDQFSGTWLELEAEVNNTTINVTSSVTCSAASATTLVATTPTDIPRTGLYLVPQNLQISQEFDGVVAIRAVVVNMAYFA